MCFHRTVGFVLDVPPAKLIVGTLRGATAEELLENSNYSDVPFIHCWAQIGTSVYAPTTIEAQGGRLRPFKYAEYYGRNGITDTHIMTRHALRQLSVKYGLADHLLYSHPVRGGASFAGVILDALGVRHALSEDGGLVPAG